jgi:hypothetical protein
VPQECHGPETPLVHLRDKDRNGLVFQCARDCRGDDVSVVDSDNGFLLASSKGITLTRTKVSCRARSTPTAAREPARGAARTARAARLAWTRAVENR